MATVELSDDTLEALAEWVNERRAERGKKAEHQALLDAIEGRTSGLSDDDVEKIARRVLTLADEDAAAADKGDDGAGGGGKGKGDGTSNEPPPPAKKTGTRKGRRRGNAYDYDVDEKGRQVPIGVARIYNGDDEPDEVTFSLEDDGGEES
jgi:hypothetical protein